MTDNGNTLSTGIYHRPQMPPLPAAICVGTPAYRDELSGAFVDSLLRTQRAAHRLGLRVRCLRRDGSGMVDRARDEIAEEFLASRAEVLCFIDSDQGFTVRAALDAVRMAMQLDLVGIPVPIKAPSWSSVWDAAHRVDRAQADAILPQVLCPRRNLAYSADAPVSILEPLEVEHIGTGFVAIHRRVFERLGPTLPQIAADQARPFFMPGIFDGQRYGEDFSFCQRWRDVGGRCWALPWHNVAHIGTMVYRDAIEVRLALGLPLG
jgi:hypothetical protein